MTRPHVLVARLDNDGDVLLAGPAIRAVAAGARRVTLLCGPRGRAAAALLPDVDEIVVHRAAWIDPEPPPVTRSGVLALADRIAGLGVDEAIVLTSYHQSALPLALVLRMAGVARVAAISEDYPGSLLDVRGRDPGDVHEVERALSLVGTLGYVLPPGDDGRLRVDARGGRAPELGDEPYVVVHPGASVTARAWSPRRHAELVDALAAAGRRVVVTGSPAERELAAAVVRGPRDGVVDLAGATDLAGMAAVIAGALAIVVGNTGPAHLAAAVGTPVVSLFAPTVPLARWRPWRVPHAVLGDLGIECAGCRARTCPVPGHPCIESVAAADVVAALDALVPEPAPAAA